MGLGPEVCDNCEVLFELKDWKWSCPICGSTESKTHAGLSKVDWKRYDDNLKFLLFVKGEINGNI